MIKSCMSATFLTSTLMAGALLAPTAVWAEDATLSLDNFWVRAMPPTQKMTAGYGTVTNTGSQPVTITGASADFAANTELHESVQVGDTVRMVAMEPRTLAPGDALQFAPGGAHLMLMGIQQMPAADSTVAICIELAGGTTACANAPVLRSAPSGDATSHHDHHSMHH